MKSESNLRSLVVATFLLMAAAPFVLSQSSPRLFAEAHVIRSVRHIHGAQMTFQATNGSGDFGSLESLRQAGFIDDVLASGNKYGFVYVVSTVASVPGQSAASFAVTATPRVYRKTGIRSFFINKSGEVRGADKNGQPATPTDPVIDDCTNGGVQDNERCTIMDMRSLHSAEMTYAATIGNQNFGFFPHLYQAGLIRSDLADYSTRGYLYQIVVINHIPGTQIASFQIRAQPNVYGTTAIRSFFIDQTGVLRGADRNGGSADQNDPPINE